MIKLDFLVRVVKSILLYLFFCILILLPIIYFFYIKYAPELPDTKSLKNVNYQIPLKIFSAQGDLIAQFGEKKRTPITFEQAPKQLIDALIATEDKRFFAHSGVDYQGLLRALWQLLLTGKKKQGGSTITMQVTRSFLLSSEKTYSRKFKEILLALKIEQELSKQEIMQLYLNKIFLGHRAYGVVAAAQVYYGKPLAELNLAQYAMIAGLPKAPSKLNPLTNPTKALSRRNEVLKRMFKLGLLANPDYQRLQQAPLTARKQIQNFKVLAPYAAEMARNEIINLYGNEGYNIGLKVYTTLDSALQKTANQALYLTLHAYDERHGYRGKDLQIPSNKIIGDTLPAKVEAINDSSITASLSNQTLIDITWKNLKWARPFKNRNRLGKAPKTPADLVKLGDEIRVRKLADNTWRLSQVPEPEAALIALNSKNGAIIAVTGGFDFSSNKFNRATQAKRQPGSGFKPILYARALEEGFTAASVINDAPVVFDQQSQEGEWRPENYSGKFFGPTRLRIAFRKSRNLVSIRLMRSLGIKKVVNAAKRFGLPATQLPKGLSLALGSGHATPLEMARIYAAFANGGFKIKPHIINRIENYEGDIIFQANPVIACLACVEFQQTHANIALRIMSPQINFLMHSLLRDVVRRGTAVRANKLGRTDLAGKTGTTNKQRDAWFNGYAPNITAVAWVGFDNFMPLGKKETGARTALPMWMHLVKVATATTPKFTLPAPEGIVRKFIDAESGLLATQGSSNGIWEYFREAYAPKVFAKPYVEKKENGEAIPIESLF